MPTKAQKQDRTINQKFGNFKDFFFLKTKKFDKKVVVDKSTYRPERVNIRAQSMILGPVGSLFLTFFATQNGLNGTIHVQWGRV